MEDEREPEELDVTPVDEPAGGPGTDEGDDDKGDRGTSSDKSDRSGSTNRWRDVQSGLGAQLSKISGDEKDHEVDDDDDLDDGDDDLDDEEGGEGEGGEDESDRGGADEDSEPKGDEGAKGGKGAPADDDDDEGESDRYEVVDKSGDRYKIDLPDGAVIKVKGDGEVHEFKSVDELIANAQKGLAFDRVTSRAGQENATLRSQISQYEEDQKKDSELLLQLVFGELDDDELEKLRTELEPYKDPKAREAFAAAAREKEREQRDKETAESGRITAARQFWDATKQQATKDMAKFEYLDAEDLDEIQSRFYGLYQAELGRLTPLYKQQAAAQKLPEADALAAADRDARKVLTEKNLRGVMRQLNERYQKRAGKGGDVRAENRARRDVEQHNRRNDAKSQQRRDPRHRSLRGGGSAPRTGADVNREGRRGPVTFDDKIRLGLRRLRQAGREAGSGSRSDE